MNKHDGFVGLLGVTIGLIGVGYAMGAHSKMAKISEKLDCSIEELAGNVPVNIPDSMIERAIEKAVAYEVKQTVGKAKDAVVVDVKRDIHKQVSDAVESEYSNIKDAVLKEITNEAAKIDVKRVRTDAVDKATAHMMDKLDDSMDDILKNFNNQLQNTSRIYNSIADSMTKYKANDGGTVFRIG